DGATVPVENWAPSTVAGNCQPILMTMDPLDIENTGSLVAQDKQERAQGLGRGPCVTSILRSPAMAGGESSTSSSVMVTAMPMPRPRSGSLPASGHRDSREVESILSSP